MNGSPADAGPAPQKYWLARYVYLCRIPSGVVLLDLRKDKYLGLGGQALYGLGDIVQGWPVAPERGTGLTHDQVLATAEKLLAAELLTLDASLGKSAVPVSLEQIAMSPIERPDRAPRIRLSDFTVFLMAWMRAAADLRWRTLEAVVDQVNARKQSALQRGARPDMKKAAELAAIFARLRACLYTRSERCLFDSLAFIHFMARHDQFPLWVLGVRSHPFGAHSWVQQDSVVLDDSPDRVYDYTPILAV